MKKTLIVFAVLLWLTAFSHGQQTLTLNSASPEPGYAGNDTGQFITGNPFNMWCNDPLDDVYIGSSWSVNEVSLNIASPDSTILSTPYNPGYPHLTVQDYQAMFLLGSQFTGNVTADAELQDAIRNFSEPIAYPLNSTTQALQAAALDSAGSYNFSNAYVLVPSAPYPELDGAAQLFETGTASALGHSIPGAPAPPLIVCIAFGAVLALQALGYRRSCLEKREQE